MVAENGLTFGRKGEKLCYLPKPPKEATQFAVAPLGMARPPLVSSTCRLCLPFMGKMILLIIDAHSKWMDIHCVNSATSSATIEKLRTTFASHSLPEIVVSDNRSNFVSSEFKSFLQKNGIKHITFAPYHPSSNGLVERAVQTFKQGMKKQGDGTVETKLARFLLSYHITPQILPRSHRRDW